MQVSFFSLSECFCKLLSGLHFQFSCKSQPPQKAETSWGQVFHHIITPNVWMISTSYSLHLQSVLKCFLLTKIFLLPLPVLPYVVYSPPKLIILNGRMMWSDGDNPRPCKHRKHCLFCYLKSSKQITDDCFTTIMYHHGCTINKCVQ